MKKSFILGVVASVVLSLGITSCGCGVPTAKLNNDLDSVAYAFGVLQGTQFAAVADSGTLIPDEQVELDDFLAGFLPAVKRDSNALKMTAEEADAYLREYFAQVRQKMMEKQQQEVAANKTAGTDFMAQNATAEGVVTTESGLQYKVITKGTGKKPKETDTVKVNYKGTLLDGTQFDANDGIDFRVNGVVPGFKEGLMLMPVGSKYIFWMPSNLAYGDRGTQGIPGGSTLCFEVELLDIPAAKK